MTKQPIPGIPVYVVQKEGSLAKPRTLHRNMLLPFNSLPIIEEIPPDKHPTKIQKAPEEIYDSSSSSYSDSDTSHSESEESCCRRQTYVIPQRRGKASLEGEQPPQTKTRIKDKHLRRGSRTRRAPERFQAGNFEHVFYVNPQDIVQI